MPGMRAVPAPTSARPLHVGRPGVVEFVDVPERLQLALTGRGAPDGGGFQDAVRTLYSVSFAAQHILQREDHVAVKVQPLEGLWWTDDAEEQRRIVTGVAAGTSFVGTDRSAWRWKAMIAQPEPIDETVLARAVDGSRSRGLPALEALDIERWTEGRCAQVLHVGPYAEEAPTIAALHDAIAAAHLRPRGRHHEIYLGDPRRSAPERLRTLLRQPVEPEG